jgi:hypothetical protein
VECYLVSPPGLLMILQVNKVVMNGALFDDSDEREIIVVHCSNTTNTITILERRTQQRPVAFCPKSPKTKLGLELSLSNKFYGHPLTGRKFVVGKSSLSFRAVVSHVSFHSSPSLCVR